MFNDSKVYKSFINNGYTIIKNPVDKKIVNQIYKIYLENVKKLEKLHLKKKIKKDYELWSIIIIKIIQEHPVFKKYLRSPKIINVLKNLLGPDLCCLGYNSIWIKG